MLHLPITQLVSIDVYRDGGSLSIAFKTGEPQRTYSLFFPIDLGPVTEARDSKSNGCAFKPPVMEIDITPDRFSVR